MAITVTIPVDIDKAQEIGDWMRDTIGAWPNDWVVLLKGDRWEVTVQNQKAATAVLLRWG